ncbi:MAG: hypothetical protein J1F39_04575 [Clostridiales bacterium]|nr:hypothetical protein [Clostridiales bacterium]
MWFLLYWYCKCSRCGCRRECDRHGNEECGCKCNCVCRCCERCRESKCDCGKPACRRYGSSCQLCNRGDRYGM